MIFRSEVKKTTAQSGNYQDNITWPLSWDHDDNATVDVDPDAIDADLNLDTETDPAICMLPAAERVSIAVLHHSQIQLNHNLLFISFKK